MRKCAVCLKKYDASSGHLFIVPSNELERLAWSESCQKQLRAKDYICSDHFSRSDIIFCGNRAMLLGKAVPNAISSSANNQSSIGNSIQYESESMYSECGIEEHEEESNNSFDANNDWRRWCRLCAKVDKQSINLKHDDTESSLAEAIETHFNVKIAESDAISMELCTACFTLMTSLINFAERVTRVQEMYREAQSITNISFVTDIQALRSKYNILEEDKPHAFMYRSVAEINLMESQKFELHDEEEYDAACTILIPASQDDEKIKTEHSYSTNDIPLSGEAVRPGSNELTYNDDGDGFFNGDEEEENTVQIKCCTNDIPLSGEEVRPGSNELTYNDDGDELYDSGEEEESNVQYLKSEFEGFNNENEKCLQVQDDKDDHQLPPYTCYECGTDFKHFTYYRSHMAKEHSKADGISRHICSICSLSFNMAFKLRDHIMIKHVPKAERRNVQCPQCEQKFVSKDSLTGHIKFVHMQIRPFICEECGSGCRSITELERHMVQHTDDRPFQCAECKKRFKCALRLKIHLETHDPKKHICPECGLQLNTRNTFRNHMTLHSDATPFKCDFCDKAFKRSKYLKTHLLLHTGLRPYKCTFCDMSFTNASILRAHKKGKHPEELAAFEASGAKAYSKDIPRLEVLKSLTKSADHLLPIKRGANRKPEGVKRRRGKKKLNVKYTDSA